MPDVKVSREELYALVWAEPVSRLAKRYGLTDYIFRQLCIRMSVPVPRQEHWSKVRTGYRPDPPPLATNYRGDAVVQLSSSVEPKTRTTTSHPAAPARPKPVPEDPLITATRAQLKTNDKRWLDNGLTWTKDKVLRIGVASDNIERACQFMAAFLRAVQSKGYRIEVQTGSTHLHIGYQPLPIVLREKTRRVTTREPGRSWTTSQLVPYGDLYLQMTYDSKEREWKIGDGALPDEAAAMLERLEASSQRVDEYYRDLERRWAENDARRKAEQALQERRNSELTGIHALFAQSTRWRRTMDLRDYLDAFEAHARTTDTLTEDCANWLAWARAKTDWYDPFLETPDEWMADIDRDTLQKKKTYGTF